MIFVLDLDGTLIDSSKRHGALLKSLLDKRNIKYPQGVESEYLEYKRNGNNTTHYLTEVLRLEDSESNKIVREWVEHIEDWKWITKDVLYDDTIPFLTKIGKNNTIIYLSNRQNEVNLIKELSRLQILQYANYVYVSNPNNGWKGKSQILSNILENHTALEITIIGDSEVDEKAAYDNGIRVFLLNRGFRSKNYWNSRGLSSICSLNEILL